MSAPDTRPDGGTAPTADGAALPQTGATLAETPATLGPPPVVEELAALPDLSRIYAEGAARAARLGVERTVEQIRRPVQEAARAVEGRGSETGGETADSRADEAASAPTLPEAASAPTLPDVAYRVAEVWASTDRLTAYQHLVGEAAGDLLPAGFVHVLTFPLTTAITVRSDFPLPILGLVHLSNTIEQYRPVHRLEPMEIVAWTEHLAPHRRGTSLQAVAEVRCGEELVWRGTSTYLARGHFLLGRPQDDTRLELSAPPWPTAVWHLGADTGRRYAAVSGDANPIHMSLASARVLGFRRAIVHGMYSAARALAAVGPGRGEAYRWTVDFAAPVFLPGIVNLAVSRTPGGFDYTGWDAKRGRVHFAGRVEPLEASTGR